MDLLNAEIIQLSYTTDENFIPTNTKTNVILAAFTTAWARLKLYDIMQKLGRKLIYYDTGKNIVLLESRNRSY